MPCLQRVCGLGGQGQAGRLTIANGPAATIHKNGAIGAGDPGVEVVSEQSRYLPGAVTPRPDSVLLAPPGTAGAYARAKEALDCSVGMARQKQANVLLKVSSPDLQGSELLEEAHLTGTNASANGRKVQVTLEKVDGSASPKCRDPYKWSFSTLVSGRAKEVVKLDNTSTLRGDAATVKKPKFEGTMTTGNDWECRDPVSWELQAKIDNDFHTVMEVDNADLPSGRQQTKDFAVTASMPFDPNLVDTWRFVVTGTKASKGVLNRESVADWSTIEAQMQTLVVKVDGKAITPNSESFKALPDKEVNYAECYNEHPYHHPKVLWEKSDQKWYARNGPVWGFEFTTPIGSTSTEWKFKVKPEGGVNPVKPKFEGSMATGDDLKSRDPVSWELHAKISDKFQKVVEVSNADLPSGRKVSKDFSARSSIAFDPDSVERWRFVVTSTKGSAGLEGSIKDETQLSALVVKVDGRELKPTEDSFKSLPGRENTYKACYKQHPHHDPKFLFDGSSNKWYDREGPNFGFEFSTPKPSAQANPDGLKDGEFIVTVKTFDSSTGSGGTCKEAATWELLAKIDGEWQTVMTIANKDLPTSNGSTKTFPGNLNAATDRATEWLFRATPTNGNGGSNLGVQHVLVAPPLASLVEDALSPEGAADRHPHLLADRVVRALGEYRGFLKPSPGGRGAAGSLSLADLAAAQKATQIPLAGSSSAASKVGEAFDKTTEHFFGVSADRPSTVCLAPVSAEYTSVVPTLLSAAQKAKGHL